MSGNQFANIINMVNPINSGVKTGFKVWVLQQDLDIVAQVISFDGSITILPGSLMAQIIQDNNYKLSNVTLSFLINVDHLVNTTDSSITIQFDPANSWKLWNPNCKNIIGFEMIDSITPIWCGWSNARQYAVKNYKYLKPEERVVVELTVTSPPISGTFPINIFTRDVSNAVIDQATLYATFNDTCN